ncbi:carboxymuconolactone decarboxylase family protein [Synechococcus sp. EJ6-Ellesmere]|uniref:carboxymuconolactone decarboxylase family protein n=1 Tax=Synechococcus sp. EJ6-Ellesmere TaxID=2823734 RepID=UPI0020CFE307|nr:carboxymuconolactone decarboxylase family protein [Synechococcus sp. EJ6-Ellesmere]MCP9826481.1 carboxymuconolactone decarboxylase family protein [Synechococcus sp. EJ6-Ellesmere]
MNNAVTSDQDLKQGLHDINDLFGELCVRVCGEVWGKPIISQKTKALITIALDVANQSLDGPGMPFEAHVNMALKQGSSFEEIEELLLFTCAYCGFNKAAGAFGKLKQIRSKA